MTTYYLLRPRDGKGFVSEAKLTVDIHAPAVGLTVIRKCTEMIGSRRHAHERRRRRYTSRQLTVLQCAIAELAPGIVSPAVYFA